MNPAIKTRIPGRPLERRHDMVDGRMNAFGHWVCAAMCVCFFCGAAFGQAECFGWGGLRGIRVDGELMAFTTGIRAVSPGSAVVQSGGEKLNDVQFFREGDKQTCSGRLRIGDPGQAADLAFVPPAV